MPHFLALSRWIWIASSSFRGLHPLPPAQLLAVCIAAMGDPYGQDMDTFIINLGHDVIISDTVTPQITIPCPLHRNAKLARIVHAGQSDLEESPKPSLHLPIQTANGLLDAFGVLNPPGHATFLPRAGFFPPPCECAPARVRLGPVDIHAIAKHGLTP